LIVGLPLRRAKEEERVGEGEKKRGKKNKGIGHIAFLISPGR